MIVEATEGSENARLLLTKIPVFLYLIDLAVYLAIVPSTHAPRAALTHMTNISNRHT